MNQHSSHLSSDTSLLFLHFFFFFNDPATTEIYPLPLHDALPISAELTTAMPVQGGFYRWVRAAFGDFWGFLAGWWNWSARNPQKSPKADRKSTRLNSSH